MRNFIFIIAIFFWVLNLIAKNKRKKEQASVRLDALNKRVAQRPEVDPDISVPKKRTPEEVRALFAERQAQAPATDYELAYASSDYVTEVKQPESNVVFVEHEPVSHFKKNYGMAKSLGTESAEEKDAYDKDVAIIPKLSLTNGGIKTIYYRI